MFGNIASLLTCRSGYHVKGRNAAVFAMSAVGAAAYALSRRTIHADADAVEFERYVCRPLRVLFRSVLIYDMDAAI